MQNHNIETLQANLHRVTKQVDAVANFKKHHDLLRSVFASELHANSKLGKLSKELRGGDNEVNSVIQNSHTFLLSKWLPMAERPDALEALNDIEDLVISMKGMTEPNGVSWDKHHYDTTLVYDFGAGQMKVKATITRGWHEKSAFQIDVSYVEFNHKSVIDIAAELGIETDDNLNPIEGNKLVAAAFKSAGNMVSEYLLLLDHIDCSNKEEIRFNLNILDEIELKDAIDSTSMDTLSATQPRQIQSLESKMMAEVDDMCESVIGSSIKVCREDVCDAIEKVLS